MAMFVYNTSSHVRRLQQQVAKYVVSRTPRLFSRLERPPRVPEYLPLEERVSIQLHPPAPPAGIVGEISLIGEIGEGRFGKVFVAAWKERQVAVKVFRQTDLAEWLTEKRNFELCADGHENVLKFIQATQDTRRPSAVEYWIVTEYHRLGSLYDFLTENTLTTVQMERMAVSMACGLCYLHEEATSSAGHKPALAHCDIKSVNVLVREDLSCVIADMGKALASTDKPTLTNIGTIIYLSPEILNCWTNTAECMKSNLSKLNLEFFRRADIYAFGLVLWELANRTGFLVQEKEVTGNPVTLPYWDQVPSEMDDEAEQISLVNELVCNGNFRPPISHQW